MDSNHDIVPTLRMFDGLMTGQAADEIERLTGYKRPSRQVDELRRRGFHRARRNHAGQVILERAHYDAVCTGQAQRGTTDNAPQLRLA